MHDFKQCLTYSHRAEDLPIWEECYRQAFPTMRAMVNHREDGDHQRAGIDRSIVLANSKQITLDEKIRRKDYGDILLERWSNLEKKVPGWVVKPLLCDYIAYAIAPRGVCYLLPVIQLQAAWQENETTWQARRPVDAENPGYTTRSYPVSPTELFHAIRERFRVSFTPIPGKEDSKNISWEQYELTFKAAAGGAS
jgi:hypothetical protein